MTIEPTSIEGVFLLRPVVHEDARGFFMETFRSDELSAAGILETFVQDNHSYSREKNTVRGLNFQWEPPMSKIMRVTRGSAFLVAVDIRRDSPTLGKWFGIEGNEENKLALYAPAGFARGFQTLTPDTEIQYKCSAFHDSDGEGEILWNDPELAIAWPLSGEPVISERSRKAPSFASWLARPESDRFAGE